MAAANVESSSVGCPALLQREHALTPTRRHVDIVYSAAVRRVGDRHLAEDITQATFLILARKRIRPRSEAQLLSWLLKTVRYAASNAMKIEARRRRHQQREALRQMNSGLCSPDPSEVLAWSEVSPKLDDAVLDLPANDRAIVLMRFYESKSTSEIAASLGVNEAAARQRLSRAVDKLRKGLNRRGVGVTGASLAALLSAHCVHAASLTLANAALATAITGTSSVVVGSLAKAAMTMMMWTKLKVTSAVVALTLAAGTGGTIYVTQVLGQETGGARSSVTAAPAPAAEKDAVRFVLHHVERDAPDGAEMLDLDGEHGVVTVRVEVESGAVKILPEANVELAVAFVGTGEQARIGIIVVPATEMTLVDNALWTTTDPGAVQAAMKAAKPADTASLVNPDKDPFKVLQVNANAPTPLTLAYRTGAGTIGLIRLTQINTDKQPRSVEGLLKVISKSPARDEAEIKPGQIVERAVSDDGAVVNALLDLDTGKLYDIPVGLKLDLDQRMDWARDRGIDAMGETSTTGPGLGGFDMRVRPVVNELWDSDDWQVGLRGLAAFKPANLVMMDAIGELPRTFLFHTREGSEGILQIVEVARDADPRHLKIRYKLAKIDAGKTQGIEEEKMSPPEK